MRDVSLKRIAAASALAFGLAAHTARGESWVVDDDGPANFRDLPTAVAAAHDGDTLLLRPGRYAPVVLQRKGLRIIGCGAGAVTIERTSGDGGFFEAKELSGRQVLVLSGVTGIGRGATISIERCAGLVLLSDLVVESRHPDRAGAGPVLIECGNAVLARVAILTGGRPAAGNANGLTLQRGNYALSQVVAIGGAGAPGVSPRGHGGAGCVGLAVQDAKVSLARCDFVGGAGGDALWKETSPFCPEAATAGIGGVGLFVAGASELIAAGDGRQQMRGGDGGAGTKNPWDKCWSFAGDAGTGVRVGVADAAPGILFSGVEAQPGLPGAGDASRAGKEGIAVDGEPEAVILSETRLPTLEVVELGVGGGSVTVRVRGSPRDNVSFIVSSEFGRVKLKSSKGFPLQALPGDFWLLYRLGRIDEHGELVVTTKLPSDAWLIGRSYAVQAVVIPSVRSRRDSVLTNVEVITIADGTNAAAASARR